METSTVWWILGGLAFFAINGHLAVDRWADGAKRDAVMRMYGAIITPPLLYFCIYYVGWSYWLIPFFLRAYVLPFAIIRPDIDPPPVGKRRK